MAAPRLCDLVTHSDGRKIKHYYSKLADGRLVSLTYNDYETTPKFHGPVGYRVTNLLGNTEVEATVALTSNESTTALTGHVDETDADPITAMDLGTVKRLTPNLYNESGGTLEESRLYFLVPASGAGTDGTNYDPTLYGYDANGRRTRVKAPHGTITRTVYDLHGQVTGRFIGTNDYDFQYRRLNNEGFDRLCVLCRGTGILTVTCECGRAQPGTYPPRPRVQPNPPRPATPRGVTLLALEFPANSRQAQKNNVRPRSCQPCQQETGERTT
jgi:YD repeat-containing protein